MIFFKKAISIWRTLKLNQINYQMCLEIESKAKILPNFLWNFWDYLVPSDIFSNFLSIFQRLPIIDRLVGFGRLNLLSQASIAPPKIPFKHCFSSLILFHTSFRTFLSYFLPFLYSKFVLLLPSLPLPPKPSKIPQHQKSQFLLNLNCIKLQLVDHGTQGRFKEEGKGAYSREFTSPF